MITFDLAPTFIFICTVYCVIKLIAGPIALLILTISGVQWITSGETPEERKKSKQRMKNVLIGLVILIIAYALVEIMLGSSAMINCNDYATCPI